MYKNLRAVVRVDRSRFRDFEDELRDECFLQNASLDKFEERGHTTKTVRISINKGWYKSDMPLRVPNFATIKRVISTYSVGSTTVEEEGE